MIQHLFLDWSGTLADDLAPVLNATNLVLAEHGRGALSREEFRSSFRLPFVHFWDHALPGVPLEVIEASYHGHFVEIQDEVDLLPGTLELLDLCPRAGISLYLLSSIKNIHFERQSARLGVSAAFVHAYTGVYDKCAELPRILELRGIQPVTALFAGDMVHDIEAARAAGAGAVAVLSGYDSESRLSAAKPDAILQNIGALVTLLGLHAPGAAFPGAPPR